MTVSTERLLPIAAVSERTSISRSTIYAMVKEAKFPRPINVSPNRVAWPESGVAAWIAARIAAAT
jgi:prophage regulatory protein